MLLAGSSLLRKLTQLWAEPQCALSHSVAVWDVPAVASTGALVPCSACEQLFPVQGTACLLAAFTRGFSGAFLECRNTLWVSFLHAETEAHLGFGSFVLWDPIEAEGTRLLLRMAFHENKPAPVGIELVGNKLQSCA